MGDNSKISWTNATWNPVTGCSVVSPGCEHCYAESLSLRMGWSKKPWTAINAAENVVLHPDRLDLPLRWRKPRLIFVNSMSDLFHEQVPDGFIAWVWMTMIQASHHTFQVLTKRPSRMREFVARWMDLSGETGEFKNARGPEATREAHPSGRGQLFAAYLEELAKPTGGKPPEGAAWPTFDWMEGPRWWGRMPSPHIWLGTSVEDHRRAVERIPELTAIDWPIRFLSCEPLLGDVGLRPSWLANLEWVIDGGESGPNFRRADEDWYRAIRDACTAAGVPYFHKQGNHFKSGQNTLLDGREWHEMPKVA